MITNQKSVFLPKMRNIVSSDYVPFVFSEEAIIETAEVESEFKWPFIGKRVDLRGKTTFTIGSLETAFSVEREGKDYILGIHSADVATLFSLDSALDDAAFTRGKSVVFPEKTYTMLPEPIAEGLCALREGEECFTVSVFLRTNDVGKVKSVKFAESVIKVTANCEPKEVESLLFDIDVSSVGFLRYKYQAVLSQLEDMFAAGGNLKMVRQNRGAADVDTAVRTFSKKGIRGNVVSVSLEKYSDPERLVREVISAAGVEVAKYFKSHSIPCPYRHRESMSGEGIKELRTFLNTVCIDTARVSDKNLVSFAINAAHGGRNEELILAKIKELLPPSACSLKAKYHGGIGAEYYVRFAYPVSRYSDLAVQRLIKAAASCGDNFDRLDRGYMERCAMKAVDSVNRMESRAKEAEKRMSHLYALEYLNCNIGKTFEGTVWGVDGTDVEVCLDNSCKGYIDGGDHVIGQHLVLKVDSVDVEKEMARFSVVCASSNDV